VVAREPEPCFSQRAADASGSLALTGRGQHRGAGDPARVAGAVDIHSHPIAEYFISEVLDRQPPEVARFMLDTSVLDELTAEACAAVTGRQDAAVMLRSIDAASLFLVALDEERTTFRYQPLVRQALRAKLRVGRRTRAG
jgi:LuxR family transcriptional regulator, maltose regulon positive regulatory protein